MKTTNRDRFRKLMPIMVALKNIPGVMDTREDEFCPTGLNVFLTLFGTREKLDSRLQDTKRNITKAMTEANVRFRFLKQPVKRGKAYTHHSIKLWVYV